MTRPTIGLVAQAQAVFRIDGIEYRIALLDERDDGNDLDPTLLVYRGLEEEAILTFHVLPGAPCRDGHPVARPMKCACPDEECEEEPVPGSTLCYDCGGGHPEEATR